MVIARALFSQGAATAYVAAVSMLLLFFLARAMGPGEFGAYNYVLTVAALLAMAQDGGFRNLLMRERAAVSPSLKALAPDLLRLGIGHLAWVTIALLIAVWALPFSYKSALSVAVGCYALITAGQLVSAHFKGEGRFVRDAAWQVTSRTLSAVLIVAAVVFVGSAIVWIFAAWAGGLLLAFVLFPGRLLQRPLFQMHGLIYSSAIAFMVIDLATTIYFRIDIVMLNHLVEDTAQVGYYAAAYRVLEAVVLFLAPVASVLFRELRLRWQDRAKVRRSVTRALLIMLGVASVTAAFGYVFSSQLTRLAYGENFARSSGLLAWLLLALFFVMPNYVLTQGAIALNHEKFYAWAACAAAALNIGLNFWLIPVHGALGAAWATLATEAVLSVFLLIGMYRWLQVEA